MIVVCNFDRWAAHRCLMQDCFELGVILLRKKLYTQATKNLEKAKKMWDGDPQELAQVPRNYVWVYPNDVPKHGS